MCCSSLAGGLYVTFTAETPGKGSADIPARCRGLRRQGIRLNFGHAQVRRIRRLACRVKSRGIDACLSVPDDDLIRSGADVLSPGTNEPAIEVCLDRPARDVLHPVDIEPSVHRLSRGVSEVRLTAGWCVVRRHEDVVLWSAARQADTPRSESTLLQVDLLTAGPAARVNEPDSGPTSRGSLGHLCFDLDVTSPKCEFVTRGHNAGSVPVAQR